MKNKIKKVFFFFKKPRNAIIAIIVIGLVLFFVFSHKKSTTGNLITIKRGSITQEVVVTGDITSSANLSLSFNQSGNISKVNVVTGDKVKPGDVLLMEDSSVLQAQLSQAEASVAASEANLGVLKQGATEEDISVSEAQVQSAESTLSDSQKSVVAVIKDAYTKADDAVHNEADQFFSNPKTNPQLIFSIGDEQLTINVEKERLNIESDFNSWNSMIENLSYSSDIHSAIKQTKLYLGDMQSFLTDAATALNELSPSGSVTQTTINTWRTDVASGRTEVGTAITNLSSAESNLNSAEAALTVAQKELALKQAPPTPDQVAAGVAAVNQAEAQVALIQAEINQTVLRSPIAGTITNVIPKKGELVTAGETVISVIGDNSLEVEAYVPEADVAKLSVGDKVDMNFDALPGENFTGHVVSIDPAETIISGVANYKTKVDFDNMDPRFKSGLTANLTIETQKKDGVLVIPQFAITQNDNGTFATKMVNGKEEQVPITLGLQDQNGNAEVLSGLSEGDQVVNIGLKP